MKRIVAFTCICFVFTKSLFGQLLVTSNGNVAVKNSNAPVNSYFTVNYSGDPTMCSYIMSNSDNHDIGLRLYRAGSADTSHDFSTGLKSSTEASLASTKKNFGIYTHAYKESATDTSVGRSYGIYSLAGNATPGYNYGVFGTLYGSNDGAGVYGSSVSSDGGMPVSGRYAGFFRGNVKSTAKMYADSFLQTSDYRYKENIRQIGTDISDNIMKLNVISYNLKQRILDTGDTTTVPVKYYTDDSDLLKKTHYGLIAQELQDIFPDLVYEDDEGYLSVNYVELIPLLIQSIQSLNAEINELKGDNKKLKRSPIITKTPSDQIRSESSSIHRISVSDKSITVLCNIPKAVINAQFTIYDTNGNPLFSDKIMERGIIEFGITNSDFDNDIYVCSLITDGDMDSRRFYLGK